MPREIDGGPATDTKPPKSCTARQLLEILVCPVTRSTLDYDASTRELISKKAGLAFPIRDGIPIMLVEEARELDND